MRHFRHNLMDLRHLMVTFIFKGHFGLIKADKKMHTYKKKKKSRNIIGWLSTLRKDASFLCEPIAAQRWWDQEGVSSQTFPSESDLVKFSFQVVAFPVRVMNIKREA